MSLELKSFRLGITVETDVALSTVARAFGRDKAEIAREILHEWALKKLHEYTVAPGFASVEGIDLARGGSQKADAGTAGRQTAKRR
jgi:hypothetical protein